jgi:hypothetical protein
LYCAFNQADSNRAGMITFADQITTRIPLDFYSVSTWFAAVETIRTQNLCCSCCTPTAEAFQLAYQTFQAKPAPTATRIVFTISDGAPWQNPDGEWGWPGTPSATYTWGIVPQQAQLIKGMSINNRIMFVGVPNKQGTPPREQYFRGIPDPTKVPNGKSSPWQCQQRGPQTTCYQMTKPPFPIVSDPIEKNIFSAKNWNVQQLIDLTVGSLCEVAPTQAPTNEPTTKQPTSQAPTRQPTTLSPTTPKPTQSPTHKPTFAPSKTPTQSPIKPELNHLDLYILMDRSRSMRWVPDLCRAAPGGDRQANDAVACWYLFLRFVENLVGKTVAIPYRTTTLGWKDSFPTDLKRGVRVWLYAFACTGHQSEPVVITVGEKLGSQQAFVDAMAKAGQMIPDGGTCPGAAIEKTVATIQGNDLLTRIYKSAILLTDGVFYDMPRPKQAAKGLFHFGVLTYSMGISIPTADGNDWGLTPAEITRQRNQLLNFVNGKEARLYNFGLEGLNLLDQIAQEFADQLPYDAVDNLPNVAKNPYWCGWTSMARCTETDPTNTATGNYCFWSDTKQACLAKSWCKYPTQDTCNASPYCVWTWPKCGPKAGVMG